MVNNGARTGIKRSVVKVFDDWLGRTELMIIRHEALGRLAYELTIFLQIVRVAKRLVSALGTTAA